MPRCGTCGSTIVFGGVREHGALYCGEACRLQGAPGREVAAHMPDEAIAEHVLDVHGGKCPKCGGPGPVDVHIVHTIWSFHVSSVKSKPQVCCESCGKMSKLGGALFSGILGWWGPHGLFMTPVQIYRNVQGILSGPDPRAPSRQLKEHVRGQLVREFLAEQRQSGPDA